MAQNKPVSFFGHSLTARAWPQNARILGERDAAHSSGHVEGETAKIGPFWALLIGQGKGRDGGRDEAPLN